MGNLFRIIGLFLASLFVSLSFVMKGNPQEPVRIEKRHLKIVKVMDGKKVELDTLIDNDSPFVWMGDTVNRAGMSKHLVVVKEVKPGSKEKSDFIEYHISGDKGAKKMVFISDDDEPVVLKELREGTDSVKSVIIRRSGRSGSERDVMILHGAEEDFDLTVPEAGKFQGAPVPPVSSRALYMNRRNPNVIDLADPGIISYKKKVLKNGNERIKVIRKEVKTGDGTGVQTGVMIAPNLDRRIKVMREGEGPFPAGKEIIIERKGTDKDVKEETPAPAEKK